MPKVTTPLTATQVKNAKPKAKVYKLSDGGGLALRVSPSGQRSWELRVMINGQRKSLYKPFEALSLAEARVWRDEVRGAVLSGNPLSVLDGSTFAEIFEDWFARWQKTVSADYGQQVYRAVQANVMPYLGQMLVSDIRPIHIIESLKGMEGRGVLEYLKRTKIGVKLPLDFAVARGLIDVNPALSVTGQAFEAHVSVPMRALAPEELPFLVQRIEEARRLDRLTLQTYCLIYWQLVTMTRPAEAVMARWSEIDVEKRLWEIPADRMKRRLAHVVPLPDFLLKMLEMLRAANQHGIFLFEGSSGNGHVSRETIRVAFGRLGIDSTAHGLRSLARSFLASRFDRDILERCLAHSVGSKTERAYDRYAYLDERRAVIDYWSALIDKERSLWGF